MKLILALLRIVLLLSSSARSVVRTPQDVIGLVGKKGDQTHLYDLYQRSNWVTPQEYGATCDDVADDTQAIAAAVASGKEVQFSSGTCKVSGALTFSAGARFRPGSKLHWTGTGYTIAFDHIDAPDQQIFTCPAANPPTLTGNQTWRGKWFATLSLACSALQTGQSLFLSNGDYPISSSSICDLTGKSFLNIEGETQKGVRLIPTDTIAGPMVKFDNTEPTTQRKVRLSRLTFFSSSSYGIANYAIYAKWTPEFYMYDVHFINVSRVYSVYLNTTFVVTLDGCNGVGHTGFSSWGSNPPHPLSGGIGLYAENTATTLNVRTCRWQYYNIGVLLSGVDAATLINNALESDTTAGIQISGGSLNTTLIGNYFEGQTFSNSADVDFVGTAFSPVLIGNFLHGATNSIRIRPAVTVQGLVVQGNHFYSGGTAFSDSGGYLNKVIVSGNTFRDYASTLSLRHDSTVSRRRLVWKENYIGNSPDVATDAVNLIPGESLATWSKTGSATVVGTALRIRNDSVWRVTATGVDYASKSLFNISSTENTQLRGQWVTVTLQTTTNNGAAPEARILDGVNTYGYKLTASTSQKAQVLYAKMDAAATKLEVRIVPAGDTLWVTRPTARLGLFDGDASL